MIVVVVAILLALLFYGPYLWIRYVMWRHGRHLPDMPGTGAELARHLIQRFRLSNVTVVEGKENADHYDPAARRVSLSPRVYHGKSLMAVAVAAHEVGHAIQFCRNEPVSHLRQKYLPKVARIRQAGSLLMIALPVIAGLLRIPHLMLIVLLVGFLTMLSSVAMYLAILPEEYDASFRKALPILEEGYVPAQYLPAIRQVLRAAALTYVAAALAEVVNLWRWFRYVRR